MKERGLKTREPFSSTLDKLLSEQLSQLSLDTRIPKSKLLDEAISLLLKKHDPSSK
ncbi:ribbon-helix-helix domain-containing protein [Bacillus cereus]|uniref:Ribbon-helix-helix domain-containing protein n=1 Tax=Bacillus cereus TaxID=1396 RepID=A0A9X7C672_BACCE|nr:MULTISPECIES: ribbon-helix-helix domain-containing protein [Bacillus cereus group]MED1560112.1 ribbon-helix-helix domain-containing protein [Bacillus paramycoides]PGO61167.1 ribbon-helix-helix domain-containing protein [Bacillus cereus]